METIKSSDDKYEKYAQHVSELMTDEVKRNLEIDLSELKAMKEKLLIKLAEQKAKIDDKKTQIDELIKNKGSYDDLHVMIIELNQKYQVLNDSQRNLAVVIAAYEIKKQVK